jgi:hypothetical protein
MLLCSSMSHYQYPPSPVHSLHFCIEVFSWRIAVNVTLRGNNEMLRVGYFPDPPAHEFHDVSTPACDSVVVMVIPSRILDSVQCPLCDTLIFWYDSRLPLDSICIFEALDMQCSVFDLHHGVIVRLHTHLLPPTQDI